MKLSLRIKTIKIILCILLVLFMLKALETLNPKKKAEYCIDDKCVTTILQYNRVISGGNSKLRIYKRNISPCVRIVVTPNNQVKGGNKEQRCPDTVKRENKLY